MHEWYSSPYRVIKHLLYVLYDTNENKLDATQFWIFTASILGQLFDIPIIILPINMNWVKNILLFIIKCVYLSQLIWSS